MGQSPLTVIMRSYTLYTVTLMTIGCLLTTGTDAIYCAQCSSLEDPLCGLGLLLPTKCPASSVACLTYKGKMPIPGADVVIRDCTDSDHGNFCQEVPGGPDSFAHSFCVQTCHTSGCNDILMRIPASEDNNTEQFNDLPSPSKVRR